MTDDVKLPRKLSEEPKSPKPRRASHEKVIEQLDRWANSPELQPPTLPMRKRSKPHTFEQRLEEQKLRLEREASELPDGEPRDEIAKRIEQLQRASEINDWLTRGSGVARKPDVAGS